MRGSRTKSAKRPTAGHTIGRRRFAKISEVEGVHLTTAMAADFQSFDEQKLSAVQRRDILFRKYGKRR